MRGQEFPTLEIYSSPYSDGEQQKDERDIAARSQLGKRREGVSIAEQQAVQEVKDLTQAYEKVLGVSLGVTQYIEVAGVREKNTNLAQLLLGQLEEVSAQLRHYGDAFRLVTYAVDRDLGELLDEWSKRCLNIFEDMPRIEQTLDALGSREGFMGIRVGEEERGLLSFCRRHGIDHPASVSFGCGEERLAAYLFVQQQMEQCGAWPAHVFLKRDGDAGGEGVRKLSGVSDERDLLNWTKEQISSFERMEGVRWQLQASANLPGEVFINTSWQWDVDDSGTVPRVKIITPRAGGRHSACMSLQFTNGDGGTAWTGNGFGMPIREGDVPGLEGFREYRKIDRCYSDMQKRVMRGVQQDVQNGIIPSIGRGGVDAGVVIDPHTQSVRVMPYEANFPRQTGAMPLVSLGDIARVTNPFATYKLSGLVTDHAKPVDAMRILQNHGCLLLPNQGEQVGCWVMRCSAGNPVRLMIVGDGIHEINAMRDQAQNALVQGGVIRE